MNHLIVTFPQTNATSIGIVCAVAIHISIELIGAFVATDGSDPFEGFSFVRAMTVDR